MIYLEKTFEVKPIGVKYICDSCEKGEMRTTGKMKMFETHAEYHHTCDTCGAESDLPEKYPLIRYQTDVD